MTRLLITTVAMALFAYDGAALAQVGIVGGAPGPSPLGVTSPLGIGPAAPVGSSGIPLAATELVSPGVSPLPPGATPSGSPIENLPACSGFGGSIPQASFGLVDTTGGLSAAMTSATQAMTSSAGTIVSAATPTATSMSGLTPAPVFDGGGTGTTSGTCVDFGGQSLSQPAASASSPTGMASSAPVGRVGIPLGSVELGAGGLSPPPVGVPLNLPPSTLIPPSASTPVLMTTTMSSPSSIFTLSPPSASTSIQSSFASMMNAPSALTSTLRPLSSTASSSHMTSTSPGSTSPMPPAGGGGGMPPPGGGSTSPGAR